MTLHGRLHRNIVFKRRARVLSDLLSAQLAPGAVVLDVGCGDGSIDRLILNRRSDLAISGIDVILRPDTHIPVRPFDGATIPYEDNSVDVVMFVDVLHHTEDPELLLREACRVTRRTILVKDHTCDGFLAGPTLRLMDWVGNAPHGVPLPYNYWPERRWRETFRRLDVVPATWNQCLGLYPSPASRLFDRSLHFLSRLELC